MDRLERGTDGAYRRVGAAEEPDDLDESELVLVDA
jgi:hypothetical protein